MRILLVPLDDRPVTYTYPQLLLKSARVEPILPPRNLMGSLNRGAQIEELLSFCENAIAKFSPDAMVLCLDSLLYGGLITSRRSTEDLKTIGDRLERIKKWRSLHPMQVYGQSSIMRISDNYDNTEEKDYWKTYGRELFEWSACLHRLARREQMTPGLLEALERKIPEAIRKDYFDTRLRNFTVNQMLLRSMVSKGANKAFLDYLVFSQDDSGTWGLNVGEKERLEAEAKSLKLEDRVVAYAGADEVACTLIARALIDSVVKNKGEAARPSVSVRFSPDKAATVASRYEGQEIGATVAAHLQASGLHVNRNSTGSKPGDSFTLLVHGPTERQGDHITLPGLPDLSQIDTKQTVKSTLEELAASEHCIIADVVYANGGDPILVEELLKKPDLLSKVKSYAGWNTTGNTMGSALALALAGWFAELQDSTSISATAKETGEIKENALSRSAENYRVAGQVAQKTSRLSEPQKQCLFTRLLDDWAYQAKVRKTLAGEPSTKLLAEQISPFIKEISSAVSIEPAVRLSFPWRRTFEIEIGFEGG
ncbi:MAG: DUF4127 family protein [Candidatus Obscuribacter sp.]|nr:DUF4127 family protein [Candidatus Obscuribacter sp.]